VLDSFAGIVSLRERFGKKLVSFNLLLTITSLITELKELFTIFDGSIQLALGLVNHTNLLVTISLNVLVLGSLGHIKAFLEELERHIELVFLQVIDSDMFVNSDQVF